MTAAELISALQHCPPDAPVYIECARTGYIISDDIEPKWTNDLKPIITFGDATSLDDPDSDKFFVLITSPY
jgi:hypothetical protein